MVASQPADRAPDRPAKVWSTIEGEPAERVAKPLIVEDELPDLVGKQGALPAALQATGFETVAFR